MDTIRRYAMFIGGDWVDSDDWFEIRSPATEELVASVAKGVRGGSARCHRGTVPCPGPRGREKRRREPGRAVLRYLREGSDAVRLHGQARVHAEEHAEAV